ncbi:unnamed protein product [Porites evermanni]|uniref:Solute carrier family 11 member 1 n=1 Tax=Porites evermanni TaxID=104178 RepID=A0ABN8SK05_9CNID|nr:unnamed protein product [Porites evermanni]
MPCFSFRFVQGNEVSKTDPDGEYYRAVEIQRRPRISTLLESLSRYEAVALTQEDDEEGAKTTTASQLAKMGTLMGVYLPAIQNIFGVILLIRLSWIIEVAGILQAFLIVFICFNLLLLCK